MVNERLFVIGGQDGDFMDKPGPPIFKCSAHVRYYSFLLLAAILLAVDRLCHIDLFCLPIKLR